MENEANLLLPFGIQKLKGFQLQGASPPYPLTRNSAPGPRWGLRPQTPVIGSLAMCVHPTFFDLATPLMMHLASCLPLTGPLQRTVSSANQRSISRR